MPDDTGYTPLPTWRKPVSKRGPMVEHIVRYGNIPFTVLGSTYGSDFTAFDIRAAGGVYNLADVLKEEVIHYLEEVCADIEFSK